MSQHELLTKRGDIKEGSVIDPDKYYNSKLKLGKKDLSKLTILSFIDPRKPWVLVPNGNLMGLFDFVPEHLRVGPWTRVTRTLPFVFTVILLLLKPETGSSSSEGFETLESSKHRCCLKSSSYPELFSVYWWYNVALFVHMTGLVAWSMFSRTTFIIVAYTIQSWIINSTRHGLNAVAPLLKDGHVLLHINRVLRFPAILSSVVVFMTWNFLLLPFLYFRYSDGAEKKALLKWNIEFKMVQFHVCNIMYSIMNTLFTQSGDITFQLFTYEDMWYGLVYGLGYGLFYVLFLDRVGAHLYPVFSPRSNYSTILWCGIFGGTYGLYKILNATMENNLISVPVLGTFTIFVTFILETKSGSVKKLLKKRYLLKRPNSANGYYLVKY